MSTQGFGGAPYVKPFSFSYSRMRNFENCPKQYYHLDVAKDVKRDDSEQILWGNAVHKALADRLGKGTPLPKGMERFETWAPKLITPGSKLLVEQQLAIDEDFGPTEWFDSDARKKGKKLPWLRVVVDVAKLVGPVGLALDWKTGKIIEDSQQLALTAAVMFAHFPELMKVRSMFVWLQYDAQTPEDFHRNDMPAMWRHLWPRIENMKHAHDTTSYPPKVGGLCRRYCPVTVCPHHGA